MKNIYTLNTRVYTSEVDFNKNIRLDKIVEKFQDVTNLHSYDMGIDRDNMVENSKAFWVLTKFKFTCNKLPKDNDLICVKTWPRKAGLIKLNREYTISINDENIIKSSSEWVLLDINTGKIRPTKTLSYPFDMDHIEESSGAGDFERFDCNLSDENFVYTYHVVTTDIDANRHTNNITYLRCIINSFNFDEFEKLQFSEFEIHYLNQSYFGDNIAIYKKQIDKQIFIKGSIDNKDIFTSKIQIR